MTRVAPSQNPPSAPPAPAVRYTSDGRGFAHVIAQLLIIAAVALAVRFGAAERWDAGLRFLCWWFGALALGSALVMTGYALRVGPVRVGDESLVCRRWGRRRVLPFTALRGLTLCLCPHARVSVAYELGGRRGTLAFPVRRAEALALHDFLAARMPAASPGAEGPAGG